MMKQGNAYHMEDVALPQHGLPTKALDYELPERLIATRPVEPRDAARLLVYRCAADSVEHRTVRDLAALLQPRDVLVCNTSAVTPARLVGERADTGGRVEGLFLELLPNSDWRTMLRSNGRLRSGLRIVLYDSAGLRSPFELELLERDDENWRVRPSGEATAAEILHLVGRTPLPPYICRARGGEAFADDLDRQWYQTVYADHERAESVAAPTAGLHFTPELLERLDRRGVSWLNVVLHVGPGTFKPVTAASLDKHHMHTERFEVPPETLRLLSELKGGYCPPRSGSSSHPETPSSVQASLIAVGTTTARALEALPDPLPHPDAGPYCSETNLLIAPGHRFRRLDGLVTNFHLPRSTLLALVAAMVGLDRLKSIYAEAIKREYRFYSYGDAMLILP